MKGKKPIFGREDCWSMYDTLKPFLVEGVKVFRNEISRLYNEKHPMAGVPSWVLPDELVFEIREKEWLNILDKIIYAFEGDDHAPHYKGGWVENKDHGEEVECGDEVCYKWSQSPDDECAWLGYKEEVELHNKRVEEGLELFAKAYPSMWW